MLFGWWCGFHYCAAQHFLVSKSSFGRRAELISEWSYQESVNYANEVERN